MSNAQTLSSFWIYWLLAVTAGVIVFGLTLVVLPALSRAGFSLLVYTSPTQIDAFGPEPVRYISLVHAVMGAVMIGWGSALWLLTKNLLARGSRLAWQVIAISLLAWFVPDTSYSLLSGFWQNAVLNTVFLALFACPLLGIRAQCWRSVEPAA